MDDVSVPYPSFTRLQQRVEARAPGANHSVHSTLTLGDLAGSERARAAGTSGAALKEGSNINKSLHHLGEVILSLKRRMTQRQGTPSHVPYRHSKLTHILKPSLGGNSNTMVFCTVSLASGHYAETVSTLKFATHAKSVKVAVSSNVKLDVQQRLRLQQQEIERLRKQLNFKEWCVSQWLCQGGCVRSNTRFMCWQC